MSFAWPQYLWLLLIVPVLVAAYIALLRRKKEAVRYANVGLVKASIGPAQRFRRHIPPLLFLLALTGVLIAVARPSAVVTLPSDARTIIMAMDVSLSMRATDVDPSRIVAAQTAAKEFVKELPPDIKCGIVTFAGTAVLVQPPTQNREDLIAAIDRFELQRHTAIGSGIIVSLATLFPDEGIDLTQQLFGSGFGSRRDQDKGKDKEERKLKAEQKKEVKPVPPGSYKSAAIILLTDGRRTTGPDPMDAARMAADHGVRVFTVGFGSAAGGAVDMDGMSIYMRFDEETLKGIAGITQAEYFHAASAQDLKKIYEGLNTKFALERKETEISAIFAGVAALLAVASAVLSLLWFNRLV
ncbi:MAG: VWA domain-containing protein [Burkholderiales bacterium]